MLLIMRKSVAFFARAVASDVKMPPGDFSFLRGVLPHPIFVFVYNDSRIIDVTIFDGMPNLLSHNWFVLCRLGNLFACKR